MILADVNVLVYAFRPDAAHHRACRIWLSDALESDEPFGVSELVLSSVLRIVTHPRIFQRPDSLDDALAFVEALRSSPTAVSVVPGPRHWEIFVRLCRDAHVKGNLVPDAYLAALAIENGAEWATTDRDFARFSGLRWRNPADRA